MLALSCFACVCFVASDSDAHSDASEEDEPLSIPQQELLRREIAELIEITEQERQLREEQEKRAKEGACVMQ